MVSCVLGEPRQAWRGSAQPERSHHRPSSAQAGPPEQDRHARRALQPAVLSAASFVQADAWVSVLFGAIRHPANHSASPAAAVLTRLAAVQLRRSAHRKGKQQQSALSHPHTLIDQNEHSADRSEQGLLALYPYGAGRLLARSAHAVQHLIHSGGMRCL